MTQQNSSATTIDLTRLMQLDLGQKLGQCRAAPLRLGPGRPRAVVAAYAADFDVDPYHEMFFFPTDTLKLVLFTTDGEVLWKKDLGPAVVPGMWFVPVFPFDLDGDGVDEIWFVNNIDPKHPLGLSSYRLERLDARTGRTTGRWPWPARAQHRQTISHMYRNFILGGYVGGEPVLVSAQGTYGAMFLQGWRADMTPRFDVTIPDDPATGARGSHMCAVVDLHGDGRDKVMWGERCIELDDGRELFCCDREVYHGHSDIVQPVLDRDVPGPRGSGLVSGQGAAGSGRWLIYTCRESHPAASPRIVTFDLEGRRLWGHVDKGHIDMGWVARLAEEGTPGGRVIASAIRIGSKTCGPDGRFHQNMDEFCFDLFSGEPLTLPYKTYGTRPVDLDGDGLHELVSGGDGGSGAVIRGTGEQVGRLEGRVALASKFMDRPGEQLLIYRSSGQLEIWADRNAHDTPAALARYEHPFYERNQRLTCSGSNSNNLGGI